MEQATGGKVLVKFNSRSSGRQTVTGPSTKTPYGYRKQGDVFEVFEADMKVRPDLFRPVNPPPERMPTVALRSDRTIPNRPEMKPVDLNRNFGEARPETRKPTQSGQLRPHALQAQAPPPPPKHVNPQSKQYPTTEQEVVHWAEEVDKMDIPLSSLDWSGTRINKSHFKVLGDAGINSLRDASTRNESQLLEIEGIGPATVRGLLDLLNKYQG